MSVRIACGLLCACILLVSVSCSGAGNSIEPMVKVQSLPEEARNTSPVYLPASLPEISSLDKLHGSSRIKETMLPGSECLTSSAGALVAGTSLRLDATSGGPRAGSAVEWAVYGFEAGDLALDSVAVDLVSALGQGAFIARANFSSGRWEWSGPFLAAKTLTIDGGEFMSPAGMLYCIVLVEPGSAITVQTLSIRQIKSGNQPPLAYIQCNPSAGPAPLAVQFDASVSSDPDGALVTYSWDLNDDGLFELQLDEPELEHTFLQTGPHEVTVKVTDDDGASASYFVTITVHSAVELPEAMVSPQLTSGNVPFVASFDASGSQPSSSLNGEIVLYEWDFNDDGSFDSQSSAPTASYAYAVTGDFAVTLRVTDDLGLQASAHCFVQAFEHPIGVVDIQGDRGWGCSLLELGGKPAICHFDNTTYSLWFTQAQDTAGSSWSEPVLLASDVVLLGDMALVDSKPAVCYSGGASGNTLYYLSGLDALGDNWSPPVEVYSEASVPALAEINGRPAICSLRQETQFSYVRANDSNGTSWPQPQDLAPTSQNDINPVLITTDLLTVNGRPAVTYFDNSSTDLKYVRAADQDGTGWLAIQTLDANGYTGRFPSMTIVDSNPAICYENQDDSDLMYIRAQDPDGSAWGPPKSIDSFGFQGYRPSLELVAGVPAVAYHDVGLKDLRMLMAVDAQGHQWGTPVVLDADNNCGFYSSMKYINGQAQIAYISYSGFTGSADLRFVSWP